MNLLAQLQTLSLSQWAIYIIIAAGIIAIVIVILRQLQIVVPVFIINILWIILAVVIGVVAIKLLLSIW